MTKPVLAGPITRPFRRRYMTHVQYTKFLHGRLGRPKLSSINGSPVCAGYQQEGGA